MKAKNQQQFTSEADAKEKLIVYVYEYLIHADAKQAAETFKQNIGYTKEIKVNDGPGFLLDWWCVFWDLYCAAPDRIRQSQIEPTNDARAYHEFLRQTPMSPSITQTSPPQHPQQGPPHLVGHRYGPPPGSQPRGLPPRMQGPPPQHSGPPGFMPSASPRYAQHPQGIPPHMPQGPMFGPGPDQMVSSPGMNRMTPVGGPPPPQQLSGPNGPPPPQMMSMMPGQQMGGPAGPPPPPQQQVNSMQVGGPPPRNDSQSSAGPGPNGPGGWQSNVNYGVGSPAPQSMYSSGPGSNQNPNQSGGPGGPMMMGGDGGMMEVKSNVTGGEPSTPHSQEEYIMPGPFGQDNSDQCDSAEIMKLKQSMQEDTTKMYEKEQSEFNFGDYAEPHNKWS